MLRIGFEAKRLFHNPTGLGTYARSLLQGLLQAFPRNEYHLFTPRFAEPGPEAAFLRAQAVRIHTPRHAPLQSWWRSYAQTRRWKELRLDLYHGLSHELPLGAEKSGLPLVVTVHDLIFLRHPEFFPWLDRRLYAWKCRRACRIARRIVAVSAHTKKDLVELFGIAPERVEVLPPALDARFLQPAPPLPNHPPFQGLPSEFLLFVGGTAPRKNLRGCLQALALLPEGQRLPLVVVGAGTGLPGSLGALVRKEGLERWVILPGRVSQEALHALYARARLLLYPSLYEGFGLPVVEALACGTPVLTSQGSSLPEAGGPGACYVNPHDPEHIAEGLQRLLSDAELYQRLRQAGARHIRRFTPRRAAQAAMALYRRLVDAPDSS
ncbi:MAG: glycosyltransferase family 1 protein [Bacteroidetes bacterium]|nr:MAG: glycosyltransferase family 1 protein [Bacteroidota bacterium]